jgi:hypothetical protein
MKNHSIALAIMSAALLSGCNQTNPSVTVSGNGSVVTKTKSITVVHGATAPVHFNYSVNPDCTSAGEPIARIVTPPAHGSVHFVKEAFFPNFPPENSHFRCNTQRVAGVRSYYRADPDYRGADSLVIEAFMPNGVLRRNEISVDVQ